MRILSVRHPEGGDSGVFAERARHGGHRLDEWCPAIEASPPAPPDDYDALVVLGGLHNVRDIDRLPWMAEELALIRAALAADRPLLGVCLGAQLVAAAAGGSVPRATPPEIGWYDVELLPAATRDPLLAGLPSRFTAFQWHSYICAPPAGAAVLARSPVCHQAFRIGRATWGVQFHPEVTRETLLGWFGSYRTDPDAVALGLDPERAAAELDEHLEPWMDLGGRLFDAFMAAADEARELAA